jgi:hypothetical protein
MMDLNELESSPSSSFFYAEFLLILLEFLVGLTSEVIWALR